jgi:hypothetical protein
MAGTTRVIGTFGHRFLVVPDSRSLERTALLGFMTLSSKGDGKPPTQSGGCDSSVPSPRFLSERGSPLDVGGVVCMGRGVEPVVDRPSAVAHDIGVGAEEGRTAQNKPFVNGCRFTT